MHNLQHSRKQDTGPNVSKPCKFAVHRENARIIFIFLIPLMKELYARNWTVPVPRDIAPFTSLPLESLTATCTKTLRSAFLDPLLNLASFSVIYRSFLWSAEILEVRIFNAIRSTIFNDILYLTWLPLFIFSASTFSIYPLYQHLEDPNSLYLESMKSYSSTRPFLSSPLWVVLRYWDRVW